MTDLLPSSSEQRLEQALQMFQRIAGKGQSRTTTTDSEKHFDEIMRERAEQKRKKLEKQHRSYAAIPMFFRKGSSSKTTGEQETQTTSEGETGVNLMEYPLKQLARQRLIEKKSQEIPDEQDLRVIASALSEIASNQNQTAGQQTLQKDFQSSTKSEFINYDQFCQIRDKSPVKARRYFAPSVFLKFPRDTHHEINAQAFFQYVCSRVSVEQIRVHLSTYDSVGDDHLREEDLENYIFEMIPQIKTLEKLQESFYPFYVFTAVRKFMFLLDPKRKRKIPVNDVACSRVMSEFSQLRKDLEPLQDEQDRNEFEIHNEPNGWFSANSSLSLYNGYAQLDQDEDGLLSADELGKYGMGTLTRAFVDRVFQEYHTFDGYMDYKAYLDFVLAMELRRSEASMRYIFHILDQGHKGYLSLEDMRYFFGEVTKTLQSFGQVPPKVDDVVTELLDMTNPATPGIVTFQDLQRCRLGHVLLHVLTDIQGFWQYDNREHAGMELQSPVPDELG